MDIGWDFERFRAFAGVDQHDIATFERMAGPPIALKRGTILRRQRSPDPQVYFLLDGWMASSIVVGQGARQIVKVHMSGDLIGMPSLAAATACDTVEALTHARVGVIETAVIGRLFVDNPRLIAFLYLIAQQERVLLMERLASIGRTGATSRVAALILEFRTRQRRTDPTIDTLVPAPLTQQEVGDLTGLTPVYVNRTLRQLRTAGIAEWRRGMVTIGDLGALVRLAELPQDAARDTSWFPERRSENGGLSA